MELWSGTGEGSMGGWGDIIAGDSVNGTDSSSPPPRDENQEEEKQRTNQGVSKNADIE